MPIPERKLPGSWTANWCFKEKYPRLSASLRFVNNMTVDTLDRRRDLDLVLEADEPRLLALNPRVVIAKVVTDTRAFRDQMCACLDKSCAGQVSRAMAHWSREFGLDENSPKPTPEEKAEIDRISQATMTCRANATRSASAEPLALQPASSSP